MELKDLRKSKGLTQGECAEILGVPYRTYVRYENDDSRKNSIKYRYMVDFLGNAKNLPKGNAGVERIKKACVDVFKKYKIGYCFLYGDYAKGEITAESKMEFYISMPNPGLEYLDICQELQSRFEAKVNVIHEAHLKKDVNLANEILKNGVKIY